MRLLIDGVSFQLNKRGIVHIWRSLIPQLAQRGDLEIVLLDRGGAPPFDGVLSIPFPNYAPDRDTPADSVLIDMMCHQFQTDIFLSTYYTTPLSVPMMLMVYDMTSELFGLNSNERSRMEKEAALSFAQRYACISESIRCDLLSLYPEIPHEATSVTLCGFDDRVFRRLEVEEVNEFRRRLHLERAYYLFVGSPAGVSQGDSRLFIEAISSLPSADFDVLCLGEMEVTGDEVQRRLPAGVRCHQAQLSDEDLSRAFNGAIALVYPFSSEEGYYPAVEAMASNCAIVTTHHGLIAEIAADAACLVDSSSVMDMREALLRLQDPIYRESLEHAGRNHVEHFRWATMASTILDGLHSLYKEAQTGRFEDFFQDWCKLRKIQASVDY